jgi:ribosomal-protein-alanine N-acetyltransferase
MCATDRLILRRMNKSDINEIFKMRSDSEIMRFIREPQTNPDETWNWIKLVSSEWETTKIGFCAVVEKDSMNTIGWCGLWRLKETDEIEVGYAIAKEYQRKGFATEAAAAVLEYGFDEIDLEEIVAVAYPDNAASQNVMKQLGMSFDYTGEFYGRELVHYSISKTTWKNRKDQDSVKMNHA